MADFLPAYERTILIEGGYKLHTVQGDRGGMTYAGIARKFHPKWPGWAYIDRGEPVPAPLVREFYKAEFWDKFRGDEIAPQRVAESIYDFAVNAGISTSVKLAQAVVGVTPDGVVGPRTIAALNDADAGVFHLSFALAKVRRYADICNRDRTQDKFLRGWINRTLKGLA